MIEILFFKVLQLLSITFQIIIIYNLDIRRKKRNENDFITVLSMALGIFLKTALFIVLNNASLILGLIFSILIYFSYLVNFCVKKLSLQFVYISLLIFSFQYKIIIINIGGYHKHSMFFAFLLVCNLRYNIFRNIFKKWII